MWYNEIGMLEKRGASCLNGVQEKGRGLTVLVSCYDGLIGAKHHITCLSHEACRRFLRWSRTLYGTTPGIIPHRTLDRATWNAETFEIDMDCC